MTECLDKSDLELVAQSTLNRFDDEVAALEPELCVPFNQVARTLEGKLLTIYEFVVRIVRREDDIGKVASLWAAMVSQCDAFAQRLRQLSVAHPACGAEFYYDRVLDLRNKCQRLQQMHS